jgi:acyl-CoA synthetase (AMP-forming)/AMP-acid ligase II
VVFGINHPGEDDRVVAVIEARAGHAVQEIVDHVRRRIRETAGLDLDDVAIAAPGGIPRTTSGKVRRSDARERYLAGRYNR